MTIKNKTIMRMALILGTTFTVSGCKANSTKVMTLDSYNAAHGIEITLEANDSKVEQKLSEPQLLKYVQVGSLDLKKEVALNQIIEQAIEEDKNQMLNDQIALLNLKDERVQINTDGESELRLEFLDRESNLIYKYTNLEYYNIPYFVTYMATIDSFGEATDITCNEFILETVSQQYPDYMRDEINELFRLGKFDILEQKLKDLVNFERTLGSPEFLNVKNQFESINSSANLSSMLEQYSGHNIGNSKRIILELDQIFQTENNSISFNQVGPDEYYVVLYGANMIQFNIKPNHLAVQIGRTNQQEHYKKQFNKADTMTLNNQEYTNCTFISTEYTYIGDHFQISDFKGNLNNQFIESYEGYYNGSEISLEETLNFEKSLNNGEMEITKSSLSR